MPTNLGVAPDLGLSPPAAVVPSRPLPFASVAAESSGAAFADIPDPPGSTGLNPPNILEGSGLLQGSTTSGHGSTGVRGGFLSCRLLPGAHAMHSFPRSSAGCVALLLRPQIIAAVTDPPSSGRRLALRWYPTDSSLHSSHGGSPCPDFPLGDAWVWPPYWNHSAL